MEPVGPTNTKRKGSPKPTEANKGGDQLMDLATLLLGNIDDQIKLADTKAGFTLAAAGFLASPITGLGGGLVARLVQRELTAQELLASIVGILMIVSTFLRSGLSSRTLRRLRTLLCSILAPSSSGAKESLSTSSWVNRRMTLIPPY
jgi:hypothetical protein